MVQRLFQALRHPLSGSIRHRLIVGIAVVHALLMSLFVYDMVERHGRFLTEQSHAQAAALAQTLATSCASWVLANDVVGLAEVVHAQAGYPGLLYAMVLSPDGKVLAHSLPGQLGLYAVDPPSKKLRAAPAKAQTLVADDALVDVAAPVLADDGRLIGWARAGVSLQAISTSKAGIITEGLIYILGAVLVGVLFAVLMARRLTRSLRRLTEAVASFERGDLKRRAHLTGRDEIALLGGAFDAMAETVASTQEALIAHQVELGEKNKLLRHEIEERQKAEQALRELNVTLEQRVQEEVAQNREKDHLLIQQSRLAAMGEMVHNIAHQWRQPLNTLGLVITNLKDDYEYGTLDKAGLEKAAASSFRLLKSMSTTIDDFRNFFKPDRVQLPFDLANAVRATTSLMEAALRNNHIALEQELAPGLETFGFPSQYSQAILNLMANAKEAIQAHRPGDGKIRLSLTRQGDWGTLTISDNGGGIPPEILPRIFDPYFTTKEKGSGIGLYMTKMILERHMGGQIEVANIDQGAQFTIRVPLAPREQPVAASKATD